MENDKFKDYLFFQIRRSIIGLYKNQLEELQRLKQDHDEMISSLKERGDTPNEIIEALDYFDEKKFNYIRKKTLDVGNEGIRDLESTLEKIEVTLKDKEHMSKKSSKWLYRFSILKEVESQESETSKNEKGDDVTVTKTVTKEEPVYFGIRKASRKMFDEGELFYGVTLSQGIKSGLLTKAQLAKRYDNDGGFLSEPDKEEYANLYLKLFEKENELQKVQLNLEKASESKKKEELSGILIEMTSIREQIQSLKRIKQTSSIRRQKIEPRIKLLCGGFCSYLA